MKLHALNIQLPHASRILSQQHVNGWRHRSQRPCLACSSTTAGAGEDTLATLQYSLCSCVQAPFSGLQIAQNNQDSVVCTLRKMQ
jgi:hypothetical protein